MDDELDAIIDILNNDKNTNFVIPNKFEENK
jgi:hypothetical protein